MNQPEIAISVTNLKRTFGKVQAVKDVSFDIRRGSVTGFIGANGAGKTTTMRMLATLEQPDAGEIRICGIDAIADPNAVRARIGWVPDDFGRYEFLTIWEYLDFFARAFDFKGQERRNRVDEVLSFTGLVELQERSIDKLSKGQGQRLCLARALLHDPEILILDEPAAGLDPKARIELKNLIRILGQEGKTLLISSHILTELAEMCSDMLFIDAGKIIHHGSADSLKRGTHAKLIYNIETSTPPEDLATWATLNPGIELIETHSRGVRLAIEEGDVNLISDTLRRMLNEGHQVVEFRREERRLEDAFVDLIGKLEGSREEQD